jgi:hypothetical protein
MNMDQFPGQRTWNTDTIVPFVIDSAAPGDTLTIHGPAGALSSQPLFAFEGATIDTATSETKSFTLNATGNRRSSTVH